MYPPAGVQKTCHWETWLIREYCIWNEIAPFEKNKTKIYKRCLARDATKPYRLFYPLCRENAGVHQFSMHFVFSIWTVSVVLFVSVYLLLLSAQFWATTSHRRQHSNGYKKINLSQCRFVFSLYTKMCQDFWSISLVCKWEGRCFSLRLRDVDGSSVVSLI